LHKNNLDYYLLIEFAEKVNDVFVVTAYTLLPIVNEDGAVNYGNFELEFYPSPVVNPPNKDPLEGKVSITIEDCREVNSKPSVPQSVMKKVPVEIPEVKGDDSVVIDNNISLNGTAISSTDSFTIYLDGMRFIPENCGLIKVTLNGLSATHAKTITVSNMTPNQSVLYPRIDSTISMPSYCRKRIIKVGNMDPTTILVGMMETYDLINRRFKVLGYFAVNLFVDGSTGQPVVNSKATGKLNEENFQLPIYCELPIPKPLTMNQL
jgi:hypothetical protein